MANSGSATTGSSHGRSATFEWWYISHSIEENYTKIGWKVVGSGTASGYVKSGPFNLWINGTQHYADIRIEFWQGTVAMSGEQIIYHNSDGTKEFAAYLEAAIYAYDINVHFDQTSWRLPDIPRAPSYTSTNASNITEHSVRLTSTVDTHSLSITEGGWDLSTDGGTTIQYYANDVTDNIMFKGQ